GPEGSAGQGSCAAGLQRCEGGQLGICDGQTLPKPELCDQADNDCDGEADNGVKNECGTCGACEQHCAGPDPDCDDFETEEESAGVVETPEGWLTLGGHSSNLHVIWPSSAGNGQVLRVDSRNGDILGAYYTGPNHGPDFGGGDSPSRTAVDDYGSV